MLCPPDRYDEVISKSDYYDYPGNVFQNALIEGIDKLAQLKIITAPNIKRFKGIVFKSSKFSHNGISSDICLSQFDIPGVKEIISAWNFKKVLKTVKNIDAIIIYSTSFPALYSASYLKRINPHIRIVNIITDLPEHVSYSKGRIYCLLKSIGLKLYNYYSKYLDGYILLSSKMIDKLPGKNLPYLQLEGIYSNPININTFSKILNKSILYSGAFEAKYGIIDLLDAFDLIKDKDFRLYLCGYGSEVDMIKQRASNDPRIIFLGKLEHSKVLELQSQVSLLVNPRPSNDEYTMYSFPSKTIEYMASGTPVLMTKLKSLPEEYYKYLYFIESETPIGIRDKIIEIFNISELERKKLGQQASEFIRKNKTAPVQASRIMNFIKNLH